MTGDEVTAYLKVLDVSTGRKNVNLTRSTSYYYCRKPGCGKGYRVVRLFDLPEDCDDPEYYLEHEETVEHDHTVAELNLRGLSEAQKAVVLACLDRRQSGAKAIIREFERLALLQIVSNLPVVPTPPVKMINSYLCYQRLQERGGIAVGKTSLQDLEHFANQRPFGEQ